MLFVGAYQAAQAMPTTQLSYQFAGCAGRMSAELEHSWMFQEAAHDTFEREMHHFTDMVEALAPSDGSAVLHYRIETKFAHANLLQQAAFGSDPNLSQRARVQAELHLSTCRNLLLGGA